MTFTFKANRSLDNDLSDTTSNQSSTSSGQDNPGLALVQWSSRSAWTADKKISHPGRHENHATDGISTSSDPVVLKKQDPIRLGRNDCRSDSI